MVQSILSKLAVAMVVSVAAGTACVTAPLSDEVDEPDALSQLPERAVFSAPELGVFDADLLRGLETSGLALHTLLSAPGPRASQLASTEPWKSISRTLKSDIDEQMAKYGVRPMRYPISRVLAGDNSTSDVDDSTFGRTFDPNWLVAGGAQFELVAVVNRLDKWKGDAANCGETRLVYRLAYTHDKALQRLPFTLNLVFDNAYGSDHCAGLAAQWLAMRSTAKAKDYLRGPLASLGSPARLEVNFQSFRTIFPDDEILGGRFEYILRAFALGDGGAAAPLGLVNTPRDDLNPAEQAELADFVRANASQVDSGAFVLPTKFLATRAISGAPYGMSLEVNRPFSRYLGRQLERLSDLPLKDATMVPSAAAFARRLDQLSCVGCHVSGSIAGFHVVGRESDSGEVFGKMELGVSRHFMDSMPARRERLRTVALGTPVPWVEPFAERPLTGAGMAGSPCGLGDAGFAAWTCQSGLTCLRVSDPLVGVCVHPEPTVGEPCTTVDIVPPRGDGSPVHPPFVQHDPSFSGFFDSAPRSLPQREASYMNCNTNGWPGGDIQVYPYNLPASEWAPGRRVRREGQGDPVAIAIPVVGRGLNGVMLHAKSDFASQMESYCPRKDRFRCETTIVGRCDASQPCRDNYACGRVSRASKGNGACFPPYFIPSLQILGHDVAP